MKLIQLLLLVFAVSLGGCQSSDNTGTASETRDPLVSAIQKKNQVRILELLEAGYPIEGRTEQKNEPAYWAVVTNNSKALESLIEHGLELDTDWGMHGGNLLTNAVQFGHFDIVRILVESGAPVLRDAENRRSPLYSSVIYEQKEIEHYLRSKGAKLNDWDLEALEQLGINKN
jgi:ankyrin repeat protein